jgi:hypothetical protein
MNSSKKKSEVVAILDDLRHEDPRKRLAAVQEVKEAAAALGPARVRSDLISFLACISTFTKSLLTTKRTSFWNCFSNSMALALSSEE